MSSESDKTLVIIETVGKLLAVILPVLADIIIKWKQANVTLDDLRSLADTVKSPDSYFGEK